MRCPGHTVVELVRKAGIESFSLLKRETYTFPAVVEKREKRKQKKREVHDEGNKLGSKERNWPDLLSEFSEHIANIKLDTIICIELNSPKF